MSDPHSAPEAAVEVNGVSKRFRVELDKPSSLKEAVLRLGRNRVDNFWVLRDVSLSIPRGSFFGLVGHNGSGKSTLLRLMAGIHRPTSGEISTRGRLSALLELGAGFHPDLTGRENVYLNGAMLGLGRRQMADAIDAIVDFSGVGTHIDAPVKIYSSGMYARLGFAVAVNVNPEILLVDEVIAVGDEEFQHRCLNHMETLRAAGTTIVLVSHDTGLVRRLCDTAGWLHHGRLQASGEPATVLDSYLATIADTTERAADTEPRETAPTNDRHHNGAPVASRATAEPRETAPTNDRHHNGAPVASRAMAEHVARLSVVMPCYNEAATVAEMVHRVLASPHTVELVIVDDGSTDGTAEALAGIDDPRVRVLAQPRNMGKGAALRRGFAAVSGDFVVVQDADLEYSPDDWGLLLDPLLRGDADVVYGSRFVSARPRRVLYFWHSVGNRLLTTLSNAFTDLNLTDMETCYKAFRREVIQSITIEEDRFGFEPEVTAKVAAGGWRVWEVGISYSGRTYAEGKKIGWRDGLAAVRCIVKYGLRLRRRTA